MPEDATALVNNIKSKKPTELTQAEKAYLKAVERKKEGG